jgi:starch-binding outer membrane protein SusE/F
MKFLNTKIFSLLFAAALMVACEKEEDRVVFGGGVAPVLTVSSTDDLILEKSEQDYQSLQFQWTNPDYEFSNGVNTQDVNYTLEIDTTGSNFTNDKMVSVAIPRDLGKTFTVKDLNTLLSGLELADYEPHPFEFRIKSTLATGAVPLYSNVVKINVTTYLDVVYPVPDKLYITGAATPASWMGGGDAPNEDQELTKINTYTFQLESLEINGGEGFLFVPVYGNWDNKYGFTGEGLANNVAGDSFKPGGNDFKAPADGTYKITVNFKTGKYSMEAI